MHKIYQTLKPNKHSNSSQHHKTTAAYKPATLASNLVTHQWLACQQRWQARLQASNAGKQSHNSSTACKPTVLANKFKTTTRRLHFPGFPQTSMYVVPLVMHRLTTLVVMSFCLYFEFNDAHSKAGVQHSDPTDSIYIYGIYI